MNELTGVMRASGSGEAALGSEGNVSNMNFQLNDTGLAGPGGGLVLPLALGMFQGSATCVPWL